MDDNAEHSTDPRVARTRATVMSVAVALLVDEGATAVTIEAIVQRSGVARSTIYRHWPRRVDLVADAFRTLMPPLPAPPATGDVRSRLLAVLRVLAARMAEESYGAVVPAVLDSAARDPELAGFREAFVEAQRAPLGSILRAAVTAGELPRGIDVDGAIASLVGPLFFRRVVLAQPLAATAADHMVDTFLRSHANVCGHDR